MEAFSWQSRHSNNFLPLYTQVFKDLIHLNFYEYHCNCSIFISYRENLSKDLYLMSQMDSDQFVPIWTIASMEGVKLLTTDMDLILEVLRGKTNKIWPVSKFVHALQCFVNSLFSVLLSLSHGAGGWEGWEGTAKPQAMHHHPPRGSWDHACRGESTLYGHLFWLYMVEFGYH